MSKLEHALPDQRLVIFGHAYGLWNHQIVKVFGIEAVTSTSISNMFDWGKDNLGLVLASFHRLESAIATINTLLPNDSSTNRKAVQELQEVLKDNHAAKLPQIMYPLDRQEETQSFLGVLLTNIAVRNGKNSLINKIGPQNLLDFLLLSGYSSLACMDMRHSHTDTNASFRVRLMHSIRDYVPPARRGG